MGRPAEYTSDGHTKFTPETLKKLEDAFLMGMNNKQACFMANLSETLFYLVVSNTPEYLERFASLQEAVKVKAKAVVAKAIEKGDLHQANWYLERKSKDEFSLRTEQTGKDGAALPTPILNVFTNNSDKEGSEPQKED